MNKSLKPVPVAPTGTRRELALIDGVGADGRRFGGTQMIDVPVYPPSPRGEAVRETRRAYGVTLRAAAEAMGLSPSALGGLECGRLTLDDDGWREVERRVRGVLDGAAARREEMR